MSSTREASQKHGTSAAAALQSRDLFKDLMLGKPVTSLTDNEKHELRKCYMKVRATAPVTRAIGFGLRAALGSRGRLGVGACVASSARRPRHPGVSSPGEHAERRA
eukprot:7230338-Prymnesium_polylepis.1